MQYRLTIQQYGSNDPPNVEEDFASVEEAVAAFVNRLVASVDPELELKPHPFGPGDLAWIIKSPSLIDGEELVEFVISITRWDDDEFSSYEDSIADAEAQSERPAPREIIGCTACGKEWAADADVQVCPCGGSLVRITVRGSDWDWTGSWADIEPGS